MPDHSIDGLIAQIDRDRPSVFTFILPSHDPAYDECQRCNGAESYDECPYGRCGGACCGACDYDACECVENGTPGVEPIEDGTYGVSQAVLNDSRYPQRLVRLEATEPF